MKPHRGKYGMGIERNTEMKEILLIIALLIILGGCVSSGQTYTEPKYRPSEVKNCRTNWCDYYRER